VPELDLTREQIAAAAVAARSTRELARRLGLGDDSASRKALQRAIDDHGITDTWCGNARRSCRATS
jgi:transposase-like protein